MFASGVIRARARASSARGLVVASAALLSSACADPVARPLDLPLASYSVVFAADDAASDRAMARLGTQRAQPREQPAVARPVTRRLAVANLRSAAPLSPRVQRGGRESVSLALGTSRAADPMRVARSQRRSERLALERLTRALRLARAIVTDSSFHAQAFGSWALPAEPDPRRLPTRGPPRA